MAKAISTLPVGALVRDVGTKYNDSPIAWRVADQNHVGYPANCTTLISDKIITLKCIDAAEPDNSNSDRREGGNNRWIQSNIRQWLNSAANPGEWFVTQHSADTAPTSDKVMYGYNPFELDAGFLSGFTANMCAALLSTTHTVCKASVDGGSVETCTDKVFLPSCTEVGISGDVTAGKKLALFGDNSSRVARPTPECVANSEYTDGGLSAEKAWSWWVSDPYAQYPHRVRRVEDMGALNWSAANCGYRGIRPICNVSSEILVSDDPDADGVYTLFVANPGLYIKHNGVWIRVEM